jgi:hypothetical protein
MRFQIAVAIKNLILDYQEISAMNGDTASTNA